MKTESAARLAKPNQADRIRWLATRDTFSEAIEIFSNWSDGESEPTVNYCVDFKPVELRSAKRASWFCGAVIRSRAGTMTG
jgi:hypothetical protein